MTDERKSVQQGITTTINAKTATYLWQPWFALLSGGAGLSVFRTSTNNSEGDGTNVTTSLSSKSIAATGDVQLSLMPRSKFPFQAHYTRNDSRVTGGLSALDGYTSQSLGFTQNYSMELGSAMLGWDRNTQKGANNAQSGQDNLQLSLSRRLGEQQRVVVNGNSNRNTHDNSGERAVQSNLSVQHSFTPDPDLSVESMANVAKSGAQLASGHNDARVMQLSSFAFWRPEEWPVTVTGGARLLALANNTSFDGMDSSNGKIRTANGNIGLSYEFSETIRMSASANLNLMESNGARALSSNESASISYQPEPIAISDYRYSWSTSVSGSNSTGGQDSIRQLALQLGHGLNRNIGLSSGSAIAMSFSQSISSAFGTSSASNMGGTSTKQLSTSGTLSWNLSHEDGMALVSFNVSDARALGGNGDAFQLINLQASSNLSTGVNSSWTGNLTIQATRQSSAPPAVAEEKSSENPTDKSLEKDPKKGFVASSSGSITYQNRRVFRIPGLRFLSDIKLNSQALLPMVGGPQDQESASWDNTFDYRIGRMQLRLNARLARSSGKANRSVMFSIFRGFGDF